MKKLEVLLSFALLAIVSVGYMVDKENKIFPQFLLLYVTDTSTWSETNCDS